MTETKWTTLGVLLKETGGSIKTGPFGTALKAAEYSEQGVPVISVGEVGYGSLRITDSTRRVGPQVVRRLSEYMLRSGDIVFGRKGAVDRSAYVRETEDGYFLGSDGIRVRFGSAVDPQFMIYQIQSARVRDWIVQHAIGTTMPSLNQAVLSRVPIDVPPIEDQRAVVEVLADADEFIVSLELLIAKKRAIKQGMMQQYIALSGGGRGQVPLGKLVGFLSGGTPDRAIAEYWSGVVPWISASTLKEIEVSTSDQLVTDRAVSAGSKMAPLDSTLILVRGSALHSEIRASLVIAPVCFNQDVKALVPSAMLEPKFLTYSIHANASRLLHLVTSAGNTAGVLDTKVLQDFEIWLPDCGTQRQVISVFDDVVAELETLTARLDKAKAVKQGMMQQLLTGRTRLPVLGGTV